MLRRSATFMLAWLIGWSAATAQVIPLAPFTIDHKARQNSPADVSFLLDAPAGQGGFIRVEGGHLVKPDGERFRIWGVNLTGWTRGATLAPPKEEAPLWADALARAGVNCVRFHFLDLTTRDPDDGSPRRRPSGLIDRHQSDTQKFDPEQLDRLDFFIAQLKERGIYSNLNLNVGRTYKAGDGVPDWDQIAHAKGMTYIGDRLLELQRDYARQLLTHYNPYTKSEYRHEPAIAIVEIVNENSIVEFWLRNWLRGERKPENPDYMLDLTPYYEQQLTEKYNAWLQRTMKPEQLALLREQAGVGQGDSVPRLHREEFREAPDERFHAEATFYTEMEKEFFLGMKRYLQEELGVKSLVVGTADHTYWIPNQPLLRSTSLMDIVDGHVYWQHPAIWGRRNTPMVDQPLRSTVVKLGRSAFAGKPYTVSEVNHPNPNEYASEMIPILAAYAAFQDWDGIFFYTFEPKAYDNHEPFVPDNFDITLDPVKMVQMPVGALLFSRADVSPARETVLRSYSTAQVNESMRLPEAERPYFTPGFPLAIPLRHGSRIGCLDCEPTGKFASEAGPPFVSDTGQLAWHTSEDKGGLVTIDTPRTQALVGFVQANGKSTSQLAADVKNKFCAITVSSLDSRPLSLSSTLLMTACSRIENTGTRWNDRRTLWDEWGEPPTLIEPVVGWVMLKELDGAIEVQAIPLDGAARPIGPPIRADRMEDGWELKIGEPATTHYLIHVLRSVEGTEKLYGREHATK